MKSICGTLILGMALLVVGCSSLSSGEKQALEEKCAAAGAEAAWNVNNHWCAIDGYSMYPWRDQWEQEKLTCVRAGGVPTKADRSRAYWAECPNDQSVQCFYRIPRVTCNSKSVVVY